MEPCRPHVIVVGSRLFSNCTASAPMRSRQYRNTARPMLSFKLPACWSAPTSHTGTISNTKACRQLQVAWTRPCTLLATTCKLAMCFSLSPLKANVRHISTMSTLCRHRRQPCHFCGNGLPWKLHQVHGLGTSYLQSDEAYRRLGNPIASAV